MPLPDRTVLRTTLTSPFGRKVRMALILTEEIGRVKIEPANTLDPDDSLRQQNPLGKLPVLLLPCGTSLFDSRIIVDYLAQLHPESGLLPVDPLQRAQENTRLVLADGITDAALLLVYEARFRDAAQANMRWIEHQRDKIRRALAAIGTEVPALHGRPSASAIALACALGYLDWRKPLDWRDEFPALLDWIREFDGTWPELAQTRSD